MSTPDTTPRCGEPHPDDVEQWNEARDAGLLPHRDLPDEGRCTNHDPDHGEMHRNRRGQQWDVIQVAGYRP